MTRGQYQAGFGAVIFAAAIAVTALLPAQQRAMLHSHGTLHPVFHLATFGGLALLLARNTQSRRVQGMLLAAVILFGCMTEVAEWDLYGAELEFDDMLVDAVGAVLGMALGVQLHKRGAERKEGHWE